MFKAGLRYSDAAGDMEVSFLDVVAFQAAVNEETETLEVVLQMRDIPPTITRGQITNLIEYSWMIFVHLDPAEVTPLDTPGDYYFGLNTTPDNHFVPGSEGSPTSVPGEPVSVPINQLFENKSIYTSAGRPVSTPNAIANPDLDTLILTGRVPGIKSDAVFSFATDYYDGTTDRPDNYVPPESSNLLTPLPEATISAKDDNTAQLIPAGTVRAYPGPEHYAGDVLTFEIQTDGSFDESGVTVLMTLDDMQATEVSATSNFINLLLPLALDTTNLTGRHMVRFTTADGNLNETYSFDVLPADQRPPNEQSAAWLVSETDCCILHYISETAAARDIEYIAEHFQQAAEEFATITGEQIDPKLDVYIIDRIWGNGGFGGNGELVISYTDRYYGPTIGAEGLETLARHEFTHAAGVGLEQAGDGIEFNYEGLAVYVAGGHYKPEPLAERGAALYDLGHYVSVGQFLDQHELAYLYPAAMLTYIVETYGSEKLWQFLAADENPEDDQPGSLEAALQAMFGVSLKDFDQGFQAWLESQEPGEQLEDLRLTVELQDLRRQYQDTYAPPPYFILAKAEDAVARPEYLPVALREAHAPPNIAIELIIANAQQAIVEAEYSEAQQLIDALKDVLTTEEFENPLAKEYLAIAIALKNEGYNLAALDLQDNMALVEVSRDSTELVSLELQKNDGFWQILQ